MWGGGRRDQSRMVNRRGGWHRGVVRGQVVEGWRESDGRRTTSLMRKCQMNKGGRAKAASRGRSKHGDTATKRHVGNESASRRSRRGFDARIGTRGARGAPAAPSPAPFPPHQKPRFQALSSLMRFGFYIFACGRVCVWGGTCFTQNKHARQTYFCLITHQASNHQYDACCVGR